MNRRGTCRLAVRGANLGDPSTSLAMRLRLSVVISAVLVGICGQQAGAQSNDARAAVIAVADSALAAITRGDVVGLTDLMVPEAQMFPTSTRNGVSSYRMRTRESQRATPMTGIVERGFGAQAMVNGGVAMVWMPYDLYVNGAWSHCGVDVFTLVKANGAWRIASLAWSAEQPPVCEKHPSGPPQKR